MLQKISIWVKNMLYNLNVSQKQLCYIKAGVSHFCTTTDCIELQAFDFVRINDTESNIIAKIIYAESFTCAADLLNHRIFQNAISSDYIKKDIADEVYSLFEVNAEICALWLHDKYSDVDQLEEISLYVITELLYWSILFFRNLPLKRKILMWKMEEDVEKRLLLEINKVKALLSVLRGENEFEHCLNYFVSIYRENPLDDPDMRSLLSLGNIYPAKVCSIINDIRYKLIMEIDNHVKEIICAYENKNYLRIQEIGYKAHNIPEMIRSMDDWRGSRTQRN